MGTKQLSKPKEIKRFHAILAKLGIKDEGKRAILAQYGVSSTLDLKAEELTELCDKLESNVKPETVELDKLRKQLMASIYQYLKAFGTPNSNPEYVKAIACQAGGFESFNTIPKERLRSLTHSFNNQTKDLENVVEMTTEMVNYYTTLN